MGRSEVRFGCRLFGDWVIVNFRALGSSQDLICLLRQGNVREDTACTVPNDYMYI